MREHPQVPKQSPHSRLQRIREVHLLVDVVIAAKAVKRATGVGITRRIAMPLRFHTTWTLKGHSQKPNADIRRHRRTSVYV